MLQSGEDPLYIARRLVVVASEDIGLADNTMLSLATAAYTAAEKIGMPEARINLAHATVAMALSRKSTRAYRGLGSAMEALGEPGVAGLPVPVHLRNAPTRLMKELGYVFRTGGDAVVELLWDIPKIALSTCLLFVPFFKAQD